MMIARYKYWPSSRCPAEGSRIVFVLLFAKVGQMQDHEEGREIAEINSEVNASKS
jgi:hypothetical protein